MCFESTNEESDLYITNKTLFPKKESVKLREFNKLKFIWELIRWLLKAHLLRAFSSYKYISRAIKSRRNRSMYNVCYTINMIFNLLSVILITAAIFLKGVSDFLNTPLCMLFH